MSTPTNLPTPFIAGVQVNGRQYVDIHDVTSWLSLVAEGVDSVSPEKASLVRAVRDNMRGWRFA